jgi:transglutaminase-like putative cysteine protease
LWSARWSTSRPRLLDQADVELFTVRSPRAGYWPLTALDEFDSRIWRSSYGTDDADGQLPRAVDSEVPAETVTQTVSVSALAAVWLPAAFEPAAIDAGVTEVGWDEASSTLLVERDAATSDGLTYQVQSAIPQWTAAELRTASTDVPDDVADRYLQLPDHLDPAVEALARDVTAAAATPYDQALALQDFLRTFAYDLDVPPSNANDALTAFLFDTRRGYCQQVAGAFAAMARSIGIPTRVTVGFTPGIQDRHDPTLFRVRGEHAHAWDEIYLDRFGWVIVDPRPGRAPPRAEDWLGVPAQQDAPDGDGTLATTLPAAGTDPGDGPASDPAGDVRDPDANLEGLSTTAASTAGRGGAGVPRSCTALRSWSASPSPSTWSRCRPRWACGACGGASGHPRRRPRCAWPGPTPATPRRSSVSGCPPRSPWPRSPIGSPPSCRAPPVPCARRRGTWTRSPTPSSPHRPRRRRRGAGRDGRPGRVAGAALAPPAGCPPP